MLLKQINKNTARESVVSPRLSFRNILKRPASSRSLIEPTAQAHHNLRVDSHDNHSAHSSFIQQPKQSQIPTFLDKTKFKGPRTIYSKSFKDFN